MKHKRTWILAAILTGCGVLLSGGCTLEELMQGTPPPTAASQKTYGPAYQNVMSTLNDLTPDDAISLEMWAAKPQYTLGEPIEVRLRASKACYPILMEIAPDDSLRFFAPSRQVPSKKIEANMVYSTGAQPPPTSPEEAKYDFGLKIIPPLKIGTETINLLCSAQAVTLFEMDFSQNPMYAIAPDDEERLQALSAKLTQFKDKNLEWSGGSVSVAIGTKTAIPKSPAIKEATKPAAGFKADGAQVRRAGGLRPIGSTGSTGRGFPPLGSAGTTGKTENINP